MSEEKLISQGFTKEKIESQLYLNLRYEGTGFALMCTPCQYSPSDSVTYIEGVGDFHKSFIDK